MDITGYKSLYQKGKEQPIAEVFAHFHPQRDPLTGNLDFDCHFVELAEKTLDGKSAWYFESDKFERRYRNKPPKLRNYLNYTFLRLKDL
jgi:hypothetical protein